MKLLKLSLKNFKGIKDFTFQPDGESAVIYGANASGKTTLMDGFLWLLTDKDSENNTNFSIKTIDSDADTQKGLDHEVEGVFDIEGKALTLRKVFSEKWVKKRGSATSCFTGNTTDYFIDGVPAKKKEYDAKIQKIADPITFKLLTHPRYVNEEMRWEDRRELLVAICGGVAESDVIGANPELSGIEKLLADHSVEENRKIISAKRKQINDELKNIPIRIDELNASFEELQPEPELTSEKEKLAGEIKTLQEKVSAIENGGTVALKKKKLLEVQNKIADYELELKRQINNASAKQDAAKSQLTNRINENAEKLAKLKNRHTETKGLIKEAEASINEKRNEWKKANEKAFEAPDIKTVCPACGQNLPEEQIEAAHEKALALFNTERASRLKEIDRDGLALKDTIKRLQLEIKDLPGQIEALEDEVERQKKQLAGFEGEIKPGPVVTDEHKALIKTAEKLESEISDLKIGANDETDGHKEKIASLETEKAEIDSQLAKHEAARKSKARIEELKKRERELAAEFEQLEENLNRLEVFTRAKCDILTDKINSKFELVDFKLFEDQINGGVKDCCIAMVNGVPYPDLNTAARINAGIDIVNVLSEHYGIQIPMFIDHAESVTDFIGTDSQRICLVVSGDDEVLRVENNKPKLRKAS